MNKNYFLRVLFVSCSFIMLFASSLNAQFANQYAFSASAGTYTPLVGGTTSGIAATADTELSAALPIGFNFVYNSQTVTTFRASSNGLVTFHATGNTATTNDLATTTANMRFAVAPLWDDLQCTSGVTYQLSGSAPNRVLTVEFKNMEWNWNSGTAVISFQVKLYETTNVVEFVYQQEATAVNNGSASIGIMGSGNTDYISLMDVTAAPAISTSAATNNLSVKPATGQIYRFTPPAAPSDPPVPTQAATAPNCTQGTELILTGTPAANTTWYWQTSATGTSTANAHVAPHYVAGNGTYYVRAYNSVTGSWSNASSYVVSNFTYPAAPAAPVATQNPACFTTGSSISAAAAPAGEAYYWQGTTALGTSTANSAGTPMNITTSGTYYVRAYNTTTQCWSLTAGSIAMAINSYIPPAPTANPATVNICSGATSAMVSATPPPTTESVTIQIGSNVISSGNSAVTLPFNVNLPAGVTINSAQLQFTNVNAINGSWRSEIRVGMSGAYTLAATQISTTTSAGLISPDPTINLTGFPAAGGAMNVLLTESYNDPGVDDATFGNIQLVINYTVPTSTITWYDLSSGGTLLGTGSPFNAVGTSALNQNVAGSYNLYAEANAGGCGGSARALVTVNVTAVLAVLNPVNIPCNGGNTGSFTLGTVQCGNPPFLYSVNGGAFGTIPTNLTPGTYSVVMQDATMGTSAPISVVITQPAAPTTLVANNVTFYDATLGWTTTGNETSWTIIYGPTGFNPATAGTTVPAPTNPFTLNNVLTPSTTYDFYVYANCGPLADTSGPQSFTTLSEFFTWDGACGPGFIDISSTGTNANLTDDTEAGVTLPWPWLINGTTVNTITIGNNGGILFNTLTGNVAYTIASGNGLYPYVQDLNTAAPGGGVYYQSIGTAPNRQFVVLWKDIPHYISPAVTNGATFEVIYDEASGETFFLYQDVEMGNPSWNNGADAEIAVVTAAGTVTVSMNSPTYLSNNSCIRFYNAMCPNVQNMVTITGTDDAQLNWDPSLYGESNWTVVYGLDGFDPTIPAQVLGTFAVTSSDATFGGQLNELTCYDAYIYTECQADNLTSQGYLVNFCTKPLCADITGLAGTTDPDSLELTWNWVPTNVAFPVDTFKIQYGMTGFPLGSGQIVTANGINFADTVVSTSLIGSGVYQVYVQAHCSTGNVSNWVGPITLSMPVTNDIVCAQEVLQLGTTYTLHNVGATVSPGESAIAPPATGAQTTTGWVNSTLDGTLWYTFVAPASGSVRINSTAIAYNGQAAVYRATNCADFNTFQLVAANDDAIGGTSLAPNFTVCGLTPNATYYLMYDKFNATAGTFSLNISQIALEAGSTDSITKVCYGDTVNLFSTINTSNMGGTWSSPIASVNASINGATFHSDGLAYTTFNIRYRVVDGCASDSIISQVRVYGPSNAGLDGIIIACRNEPIDLLAGLNGNTDLNGDWYDPSNVYIPNSQIYTENFPGQYNYDYISGNGVCPDDTANVVVDVQLCNWLSVGENALEEVSLYPNPSTGVVFIESTFATGNFDLTVMDINGRTIQTGKNTISAGTNTVNMKDVERGTYFFKLSTDNAEKVFRVVIQ
ncbi:hypothetical protein D3C87_234950 [compost metagenome]